MRIMVISTLYPENQKPHLRKDTQVVKYFAEGWTKEGHEVLVVHPYRIPVTDCIKSVKDRERFKVYCSEMNGVKTLLVQLQLLIPHHYEASEMQQYVAAKKIKKYLQKYIPNFEPDMIAVHFPLTNMEFCKYLIGDRKALCVLHKSDIAQIKNRSPKKQCKQIDWLAKNFNAISYRSDRLMVQGSKLGIPGKDSKVLYSGVSEDLIPSQLFIEEKANRDFGGTLKILYVGNLVKRKNIDSIIRAIALVQDKIKVSFQIIGDGSEMQSLKELCAELAVDKITEFKGRLPREKVIQAMRDADVFAMLSTNETFGMVYIEAMAQGCIVLGTKDDGIDGIMVNGENGFLLAPYDCDGLAQVLNKIKEMPFIEKKKIIENAYNTVLSMTETKMAEKYLDALKEVLE